MERTEGSPECPGLSQPLASWLKAVGHASAGRAMPSVRRWGCRAALGRDRAVLSVGIAVHGQPSGQGRWAGRDNVGTSLLEAVGDG